MTTTTTVVLGIDVLLGVSTIYYFFSQSPRPYIDDFASNTFRPWQDYQALTSPVMTNTQSTAVVLVFWNDFLHYHVKKPAINLWQQSLPDNTQFNFFYSNLRQTLAQLYYTLPGLRLSERIRVQIFHENQHRRSLLEDSKRMAAFLHRDFTIISVQFMRAFNTFATRNQLQQACSSLKDFQLNALPAIVINGRHTVEPALAGLLGDMPVISDYLVRKTRQYYQLQSP